MASQEDLIISIKADTAKAAQGIEQITKEMEDLKVALLGTNDAFKKTSDAVTGFGAAMVKVNAAISIVSTAFQAAERVYDKTVTAFIEQDDAIRTLSSTLGRLGEKDVAGAIKRFQDFANQLKENSTIDDDVAIRYIGIAKAIGLTDAQTEKLLQTSADLSAFNGHSLDTSFHELLDTYKGVTRSVLIYDKSIAGLSASQDKQGAAVDKLQDKFKGFAKAQIETVGGALKQVQVRIGDVLEDIGGLFARFFKLGDQHFAIEALKDLDKFIQSLYPTVEKLSDIFGKFIGHLSNGFDAVADKGQILIGVFTTLGTVMAIAFGPAILASIISIATALAGVVVAAAPMIATIAAITAGVVALGSAIEIVIRNFSSLKDIVVALFKDEFAKAKDIILNLDFGTVGKTISGATNFVKGFNKELDTTAKKVDQVTESTKKTNTAFGFLSEDGKKAIEDLAKKVEELKLKQAQLSENVVSSANQQLALEMKNLQAIEKDLAAKDALNEKARELLKIARETATANMQLEIYEKQKKALEEIVEKNKDLNLQVQSIGSTQQENIERVLQRQLELIEKKREELKLQGLLTTEAAKSLDQQAKLSKAGAAKSSAAAPPQIMESLSNAGAELGQGITKAFAPMMGITSGVGAYVAAAQAVVDAGPQMLESITHLIESITDLPLKLLDGMTKLFDTIIKHFQNFIPNIIKMVVGIIEGLIKFVRELPKVIMNLVRELPRMIMDLFDKLPDMIEQLVEGLTESGPKIAEATIEFGIKAAPRIGMKLVEFLYLKLPGIIFKGILEGLKNVADTIRNILTGKKVSIIDTKDVEKKLENFGKSVAHTASRIFNVTDLVNQAKAALSAKNMAKQIEDAGKKSVDLLKKAWMWVMDHIITPLLQGLEKLWNWVNDHIFKPIIEMLTKAWMWVKENILDPIFEVVTKAFGWVVDNIIKPLNEVVMKAFGWVVDNIIKPLGDVVMKAFKWVLDNIIKPLGEAGAALFEGFKKLLDPKTFLNLGSQIWEGLKAGLGKLGEFLMEVFNKLNPVNLIAKIFGISPSETEVGKGGTVENLLRVNLPFVQFAKGSSLVPGQASVAGDSELNDKILALVSPGEAIISRSKMNNPLVKQLVELIMSGKLNPPKFGSGIKSIGGTVGKALSGDFSGALQNAANLTPEQALKEVKNGVKITQDLLKQLNPVDLWKMVEEKLGDAVMGIFKHNQFATGGLVDNVPSMLSSGEFVMNRAAVGRIGVSNLNAMNRGGGQAQVVHYNFDLPITIKNDGKDIDAAWIKSKIVPTIQSELKRASLDGNFVISTRGIRNA